MDPFRIVLRTVFAYVFLLAMVRLSGKRTVGYGTAIDFVLALVFGDMVDDLLWAEVTAAEFVAGAGTLFLSRAFCTVAKHRRSQ
jgi:uncharacterized membrane protein YcaP (DUF421 family)